MDAQPSRPLTDYPRPSVAVDTAVFTVRGDELCVVLVEGRDGRRRLPGTFLHEGERLVDAVRRSLAAKAGIGGGEPRQLQVFDEPHRDDRGWVLSVAHAMALPAEAGVPIDLADPLDFDHARILAIAVERIRTDYATMPDPWNLMPPAFTLRELLLLHTAVDPSTPQRDTFRRMMEPLLVETGEYTSGTVGKPSRLFRKPTADEVAARRAKHVDAVREGARRTSRSRSEEVPTDRLITSSVQRKLRDGWMPLEKVPADARHTIRLDRGPAGAVARVLADEQSALWTYRGLVSTYERPENRIGPDAQLRSISLHGPGGREVSVVRF